MLTQFFNLFSVGKLVVANWSGHLFFKICNQERFLLNLPKNQSYQIFKITLYGNFLGLHDDGISGNIPPRQERESEARQEHNTTKVKHPYSPVLKVPNGRNTGVDK